MGSLMRVETAGVAGLRRRWTSAFIVGELIGFIPPAITGATLAAVGASDALLVVGLTVAGLCEGTVLGLAQARVLGRHTQAVDGTAWVVATTAAAGFAWFVGMGGSALLGAHPSGLVVVALCPAWVAALVSMGYAQWRVLRRRGTQISPLDLGDIGRLAARRHDPGRSVVAGAERLGRMGARDHRGRCRCGDGSDRRHPDRQNARAAHRRQGHRGTAAVVAS